jgi:hypothetical protein
MRCPKCGFNSFDHLSECKKCGANLTKTRNEMGMPDSQPQMPFLLGPLLKDFSPMEENRESPDIEVDADLVQQSGRLEQSVEAALPAGNEMHKDKKRRHPEQSKNELVIELVEDDLDSLFIDLEASTDDKKR